MEVRPAIYERNGLFCNAAKKYNTNCNLHNIKNNVMFSKQKYITID